MSYQVRLHLSKKLVKLLASLLVFASFSNYCFAVDAVEEIIDFKVRLPETLHHNDIREVMRLGKKVAATSGQPQRPKAALIAQMRIKMVSASWISWFERRFIREDNIGYKRFAAAIFYPYEVVETSLKQHLYQVNYAFRACIYYSSDFDPRGMGRETVNSVKKVAGAVNTAEDLLKGLDNPFVSNNAVFIERARQYLSADSHKREVDGTGARKNIESFNELLRGGGASITQL